MSVSTSRIVSLATLLCAPLFAGTLTLTVKDPAQALVGGATVDVTAQRETLPHTKSTEANGRATFDQLLPGAYRVSVTKEGFALWEGSVTIGDRPATLPVALKLATRSTSVQVSARRSPLANSDPNYQAIRTGKLRGVYRVSNLVLTRDAGTFTFRSGSFSFLPPVLGHVTTGVFIGDGNFELKPKDNLATLRLKRMMGADSVTEDFTALVVFFSDATFDEIHQHSESIDESPDKHEEALKRVRDVIQERREPRPGGPPRSQLELMLNWEDIPNYDAEILAELYNGDTGKQKGSFRAFLHGKKYPDLRFLLNPHGAMPMLQAAEEVALIDFYPTSNSDGVWYLAHLLPELRQDLDKEEKRLIATDHYKTDVLIRNTNSAQEQLDLAITSGLTFHAAEDGVRMAKLDLMPDLQISRVIWDGAEIPFVQENRNHDGSFYLQTPEALSKGRVYDVTFEYAGTPGRVWYPTPSGPANRATYDLTFRIPHDTKLVATGEQVSQSREDSWDVSEWKADVPITRADFRWLKGGATLNAEVEETTKSRMSMYMALKAGWLNPPSANYMLGDVGNALRLFSTWFGKPGYGGISVLVQSGGGRDSLPGLVSVPPILTVGFAAIQARGGYIPPTARPILDEAFARLIAGQWWGNTISPATFHDAWLTAGLASFSASVYDLARGNGDFKDRWGDARDAILTRNRFGVRPNDEGPLWMGILNDTQVTPFAGGALNASKGAFIAQMLRAMMWDPQTLDHDFQAMMQDFVATFANHAVSSGDFQSIVLKHMKPIMNQTGDNTMDWFFDEWLYSTDIPNYRLEYSFQPGENGATLLEGKLTQSGVSPAFRMPVPIFAESAGKTYRLAVVPVRGNSTSEFKVSLSARPKQLLLNANHDVLSDKDEVIPAKPSVH